MTSKDKYVDLVVNLMRRTSQGEIRWTPKRDRLSAGLGQRGEVYEATYKDRRFLLQDARSYLRTKTNPDLAGAMLASMNPGSFYLEVTGPDDSVIEFPRLRVVDDLARLVRGKETADLEDLERILSSD